MSTSTTSANTLGTYTPIGYITSASRTPAIVWNNDLSHTVFRSPVVGLETCSHQDGSHGWARN